MSGIMENDEPFILIVEDDLDQAGLIKAAFDKSPDSANLHFVPGGCEAQAYIARESPYNDCDGCPRPSLMILDLGPPDGARLEMLEWMAERNWLTKIPVIVLTDSEDRGDARTPYVFGVRRYLRRSDSYGDLVQAVREELGSPPLVSTAMAVTSGGAQGHEALLAEPLKAKRLTGLALFSLSLFEMTLIVVAYEAMRYASTTGVVPVPLYIMTTSFIAISALVVGYLVTGVYRRRRAVESENERLILALQRSLAEVDTLNGLLPICARCKKVKDSDQYWHKIEAYVSSRSEAVFRPGLCEACVNAFWPEDVDHAG